MKETEVYCICKSTNVNEFMIGCDHCEDWFHGRCIKVTEKESRYIKKYFCPECRKKNSDLKVVYKSSFTEEKRKKYAYTEEGESSRKEKTSQKEHKKDKETSREKEKDKKKKKKKERRESSESSGDIKKSSSPRKAIISDDDTNDKPEKIKDVENKSDDKKDGKSSVTKSEDDWEPPALEVSPHPSKPVTSQTSTSELKKTASKPPPQQQQPKPKAEKTINKKAAAKRRPSSPTSTQQKAKGPSAVKRSKYHYDSTSDEEEYVVPSRRRKAVLSALGNVSASPAEVRQCYGPNCTSAARWPDSKYCSDQCGINLATMRMYQTLPDRIREWNLTPCEAERRNRKELESIHAKQKDVQRRLTELNQQFQELEAVINESKLQKICEDSEDDNETDEATIHCVTCGANVHLNNAIKHMERCYNRVEMKTSFASRFKTPISDFRMVCDFFNPKEQLYCKRLQVLCPEHNKEPIIGDTDVCGYPLKKEKFFDSKKQRPSEFCAKPKKSCHVHLHWEKLHRAEIDMDRLKMWMKLDELYEQETRLKMQMANRAGVLGLMLHSTYNHELGERWKEQQKRLAPSQQLQTSSASQLLQQQQQRKILPTARH